MNATNMGWNPPTPVEAPFNQLEDSVAFVTTGHKYLSDTQGIRYNLIYKTGLFKLPCHDWWRDRKHKKQKP
jgi:hypothetical protein